MPAKRPSEAQGPSRSSQRERSGQSSKKTRFASPEEDPATFEEDVEAALETNRSRRKAEVNTEGYDSDSSDDGEGVVNSRKKGAEGDDDDDDDMFAAGDKNDDAKDGGDSGKKKKTEYLRLGDIEGQEFGAGTNENEDSGSSDEEDEPEDEDDAERRAKVGMGYEMSSFNMREEMEEGKFDTDGTYIRSHDPHAMHDRWIDAAPSDERSMKKARRAKRAFEKEEKEKQKKEKMEMEQLGGKVAIEKELVGHLRKGETVLEALARLGAQVKKAQQKQKTSRPKYVVCHSYMRIIIILKFFP